MIRRGSDEDQSRISQGSVEGLQCCSLQWFLSEVLNQDTFGPLLTLLHHTPHHTHTHTHTSHPIPSPHLIIHTSGSYLLPVKGGRVGCGSALRMNLHSRTPQLGYVPAEKNVQKIHDYLPARVICHAVLCVLKLLSITFALSRLGNQWSSGFPPCGLRPCPFRGSILCYLT